MVYLVTLLSIICVSFSSGALSLWLHAGNGVGCININGHGACSTDSGQVVQGWSSSYIDSTPGCQGDACKVTVNLEFGFDPDSTKPNLLPKFKQDFTFVPTADDLYFAADWCIVAKSGPPLHCYDPHSVYRGVATLNPYVALQYKGPKPTRTSMGQTSDDGLQASYVDQTGSSNNNWVQASSGDNGVPCEVYGTCGYSVESAPIAPVENNYASSLDPNAFDQTPWQ